MRNFFRRITFAISIIIVTACASSARVTDVDQPETVALLNDNRGIVAITPGNGDMRCIIMHDLASKRRRCEFGLLLNEPILRASAIADGKQLLLLYFYSGTFCDDKRERTPNRFHLVRRDIVSKRDTIITQWENAAITSEIYNKTFAVSPDENTIAIIKEATPINVRGTYAQRFRQGELSLLNVHTQTWKDLGTDALDGTPVTWISANDIAYVRMLARSELPTSIRAQLDSADEFASELGALSMLPVVFVRSLADGRERALHVGINAVATPDKKSLLIGDDNNRLRLVDIASGESRSVKLTGIANRGAIGFVAASRVLYWSLPTRGRPERETKFNSPLVGPKQMLTLKVGDLRDGSFATIVEFVDPRQHPTLSTN